jgi:hypothetical protein
MTNDNEILIIHDLIDIIIEHTTGRKWEYVSWRVDSTNKQIIISYGSGDDMRKKNIEKWEASHSTQESEPREG